MKAILEFNLPDEKYEFEAANTGSAAHAAISEFKSWISNEIKHNDDLTDEARAAIEEARSRLNELLQDERISE